MSQVDRPVEVAAGVVALRQGPKGVKVLLAHRPKYDDWVLPKGHVEAGELVPQTACREFHEETGYRAAVSAPICVIDYAVGASLKRVHWFLGDLSETPADGVLNPNEIDAVDWRRVDKALSLLSYDDEKDVLRQAVAMPTTRQLLIVRHAKALDRASWRKDDARRPLAARGRTQARRAVGLLEAYGVAKLVSSTSTRCVQTLHAYAGVTKLPIDLVEGLSEEGAAKNPAGVGQIMARLVATVLETGQPLAVCGHRPVLPAMAQALGLDDYDDAKPAEVLVAHLDAKTGQLVDTQRYASPL